MSMEMPKDAATLDPRVAQSRAEVLCLMDSLVAHLNDEVARQVALLFVGYGSSTDRDPGEVDGGDGRCRYGFEPKEIADLATAKKMGKGIDNDCE